MNSQSHFTINNKGRIEELEDLLDTVSNIQFSDNFWQEEEWVEEARDAVRELIIKAFRLGYGAKQLPQSNVKKLPPFSSESLEEAFQKANDLVIEAKETLVRCKEAIADKGV
jgi:hypothetical protein